jgi:hypothetical protein
VLQAAMRMELRPTDGKSVRRMTSHADRLLAVYVCRLLLLPHGDQPVGIIRRSVLPFVGSRFTSSPLVSHGQSPVHVVRSPGF